MDKVSLTASMRSNLLSLQNISRQVDSTQNRLSTGKKVNSAIDNPSSYYTARSLSNRASDLDALLDSMGQAVSTIKAATTSLETAADFLEQAAAVATQALESGGVSGATPDEPIYIPQPSGISDDAAIRDTSLFDGEANTQAMLDQIGDDALAATACNQFYAPGVDKNDANFGQGTWYLPAIGELMEMYGTTAGDITGGYGISGVTGENKTAINDALATLRDAGVDCATLTDGYYWSSSESNNNYSWTLTMSVGYRNYNNKGNDYYVRCFQLLENCFNPSTSSADASGGSSGGVAAPKIGDVMYSDLTYGSADDYDKSKTAVGIVTWVSEDGKSAKIVNLKDLRFSSTNTVGNFNPDDPYTTSSGSERSTYHTTSAKWTEDITGIDNYNSSQFLAAIQEAVAESAGGADAGEAVALADTADKTYDASQYQTILSQYDSLIKDSSYKGVNLLQNQDLKVTFNEGRTAWLDVLGKDASSAALGLTTLEWNSKEDVEKSIEELTNAMNQIRSMSSELGSYYNIVLTRQDFTENLINVLEEGADKLTLADMNEESANMLALQTRQQLAINSLSLASQAAQGILRLF